MTRLLAIWGAWPGALRGIVLMLVSSAGFTVMHACIRQISADLHPLEVAFFRNFFGLVVFLPLLYGRGLAPLRTARLPMHLLRSVINVGAMLCFFTALSMTPLAQVTALGFSAPIFTALLGLALLGEVFRWRRWTAILIGFFGTLVILRPGFAEIDLGSLLVLLSAALWGCTLIIIKLLGRTESSITITGYMNIFLTLFSLPFALFVWRWPAGQEWLILLFIGILGTISQIALAQALKEAETAVVMPFDFFRLIWAAVLGFLLFGEVPDLFVWIGGAMILASTSYMAYRESQVARAPAPPKEPQEPRP